MKLTSLPLAALPALLLMAGPSQALDSYRYLHVTIDTPWSIFLFLLIGIFAPFVLMAVLVWRFSGSKTTDSSETKPPEQPEP
ncbi:MAG: hypothetical protein ACYDCF_03500 [Burkholderiales bacterium]